MEAFKLSTSMTPHKAHPLITLSPAQHKAIQGMRSGISLGKLFHSIKTIRVLKDKGMIELIGTTFALTELGCVAEIKESGN